MDEWMDGWMNGSMDVSTREHALAYLSCVVSIGFASRPALCPFSFLALALSHALHSKTASGDVQFVVPNMWWRTQQCWVGSVGRALVS
jgi:hypothetical protein